MEKKLDLQKYLDKADKAHSKYRDVLGSIEHALAKYIQFDYNILYQAGDGFVIADETGQNAPLDSCIGAIEDNGTLTHDDYLTMTI